MTERSPDQAGVEDNSYAKSLGARLRAVRMQRHLSLRGVERTSGGRWKAVVVGSYERGDRGLSVQQLSELADFYGVAIGDLLPGDGPPPSSVEPVRLTRIVLDLDKVAALTDPDAEILRRLAASIQRWRGGIRMRTLRVRHDDLRTLALIYGCTIEAVTQRLVGWQVLASESVIMDDAR